MFNEEGLLNKIATAAIIGLLGWNLISTQKMTSEVAVLKTQVDYIQQGLETRTIDRYTRSEATLVTGNLIQRIERLEQWNQNLSERMRNYENTGSNSGETQGR